MTKPTETPYLLDQLDAADMLEMDGLHAWQFELDEVLLDQADAAADVGQPFASENIVLTVEVMDGRQRRVWRFSYNQIMEALYLENDDSWSLDEGKHRLRCMSAISAVEDD